MMKTVTTLQMRELEKTISKLESTYVVERGKVSTTIYFHKSSYDCVNYRVTYNFEACLTYIAQYHSNAHSNHHQGSKTYFHIFNIDGFQKAEDCFINGNPSLLGQDDLIEPKNKRGAKVRIKALLELKDFDRDHRGSVFRDEIEEALRLCERLMRVQITKQEENGYSWLVETNEVIDNVETLVRFLEEQRKDYDYNEDTKELFANPKNCTAMDDIAAREWNN